MSDLNYRDSDIHKVPVEARRIARYFGSIIAKSCNITPDMENCTGIQCRRRPGRKPCGGIIHSTLSADSEKIHWYCPKCGDNGYISNWKGTRWDPNRGGTMNTEYENIKGKIESK